MRDRVLIGSCVYPTCSTTSLIKQARCCVRVGLIAVAQPSPAAHGSASFKFAVPLLWPSGHGMNWPAKSMVLKFSNKQTNLA